MSDTTLRPMDYSTAKILGLRKYLRIKPCKRGHRPSWHYTSNNSCVACTKMPFSERCARNVTSHPGSRRVAKAIGAKRYFTGYPCSKGHIAERYTSTSVCVLCRKIQKRREKGRTTVTAVNALGETTLTLHNVHLGDREAIRRYADNVRQLRLNGLLE